MPQTHATLNINLDALAANYHLLQSHHKAGNCAAVVKANAYGLGVEAVSQRLWVEGCKTYFVATLEEALQLRDILPDAVIYIFQGALTGEGAELVAHNLRPVLNSPKQIVYWQKIVMDNPQAASALHIDTGMCRLGLSAEEVAAIDDYDEQVASANIQLLMSHLACASEPSHPLNQQQLTAFEQARQHFSSLPCSLANSAGHFLSPDFHYDIGRPGCSLYGITPTAAENNPMQHVATLSAPILQIRNIEHSQNVGYGATATVKTGQKLATIALGYADGLHRIASGTNMYGYIAGHKAPLVGRVSMDMTCYDVTNIPQAVLDSAHSIEIINQHQTVDKLADICHTIGYEIFTRLGRRVKRVYANG